MSVSRSIWKDPTAFAALYEEYVDCVYRHIYYFVHSQVEAEELTAETFLRAWSGIGRYQDRGKPILSWLLTIAHNLVVSRFRHGRRVVPLSEGVADRGHANSPEEASIARWQHQEIVQGILQLRPLERQVILLRFVDGMEYAEVARALNKTVNAARIIQYRALSSLRKILEER